MYKIKIKLFLVGIMMLFICKMITGSNVKASEEIYDGEKMSYYMDYA